MVDHLRQHAGRRTFAGDFPSRRRWRPCGNSQWENQKKLYQPKDAVYLCPRAIQDTWDLHFVNEADAFYDAIIRYAVSALDVNPDKVYIMGYSAGGDGGWRLGHPLP